MPRPAGPHAADPRPARPHRRGKAWAPKDVAATLGDYPALGRKAAAALPGAKLVELDGVGHLPQVEAFDRYRDALVELLR